MKVKYDLVLDFARPSKTNTIIISEDDTNSRLLHFTLLNDKHPMSMTDITSATIRGLKTDGSVIFGDATILVDDDGNRLNEVEYVIPAAMSDTAGNITITLTLNSMSNEQLTSFEFYIQVRNALYNEDDLVSESDLKGFRDLLNRALAAVKTVEDLSKNETLPNPYPLKIDLEGTEYTYTGRDTVEVYMTDMAYIAEDPVIEVDELDRTSIHVAAQSAAEAKEYADQAKGSEDVVTAYAEEVRETKTILEQSIGLVESYANLSVENGLVSEGYAKGTQNGNPVSEDSPYYNNNAEYFASKVSIEDRLDSASTDKSLSANQGRVLNDSINGLDTRVTYLEEHGGGEGGTTNYNFLTNKPQINGVTLSGDKSASDLGLDAVATTDSKGLVKPDGSTITIDSDGTIHAIGGGGEGGTTDYNALSNKPQINGVALSGNKSLSDIGVPTSLSQLTEDATHRTVTDVEKAKWNNAGGAETWAELSGKPFESIGENLNVEDGVLNAKGGTEIPSYTLAQYEEIKDNIPTGTQFVITDDYDDALGGLRFGYDAEGNYGYYKVGADTLTPFKSGSPIVIGSAVHINGGNTIDVGFTPNYVMAMDVNGATEKFGASVYNKGNNIGYFYINASYTPSTNSQISIVENGFYFGNYMNWQTNKTFCYIAAIID